MEKRTALVTIENIQKLKNNLNPFKNIKKNIFTNGYVKFKKRYRNDAYKTLRAFLLRITSYVYKGLCQIKIHKAYLFRTIIRKILSFTKS